MQGRFNKWKGKSLDEGLLKPREKHARLAQPVLLV